MGAVKSDRSDSGLVHVERDVHVMSCHRRTDTEKVWPSTEHVSVLLFEKLSSRFNQMMTALSLGGSQDDRRHKAPVRYFVIWPTKLPFKCHPYLQIRYSISVHIIDYVLKIFTRAIFRTKKKWITDMLMSSAEEFQKMISNLQQIQGKSFYSWETLWVSTKITPATSRREWWMCLLKVCRQHAWNFTPSAGRRT